MAIVSLDTNKKQAQEVSKILKFECECGNICHGRKPSNIVKLPLPEQVQPIPWQYRPARDIISRLPNDESRPRER